MPESTPAIEELDFQQTPLGEISLRRRIEPRLDGQVLYEVKLGDEFLMSSLFVEGEVALADLALEAIEGDALDVVVGGLGLGHTAAAALAHDSVATLSVIDVMPAVIDWHRRGLVPMGETLTGDARCALIEGDFFALAAHGAFFPNTPDRKVDAVLLDIDHAPDHWLHPSNAGLYTTAGLHSMCSAMKPGAVFGLWSNDPPDPVFNELLETVFHGVLAHRVEFPNPYSGGIASNSVYLGTAPG